MKISENLSWKKLIVPGVVMLAFWSLATAVWLSTGEIMPLFFFGYIGTSVGVGLGLYAALPKKQKPLGRRLALFLVGAFLFGFAGIAGAENIQIEGLFFGLLTGVVQAAVIHYLIAKIFGSILFGRLWCGWACWTVMVLDLLPFKRSRGRLPGRWGWLRYAHFSLSLGLVLALWYGVGYGLGVIGVTAVYWFLIGNGLYYLTGIGLASTGVRAGRLTNWTVEDVRIAGNGWAGWDEDIEGADSNAGALVFRRWRVEWNGCAETYPGGEPAGCWAQTAGGYGDGVGTGQTGGQWLIEDSAFLRNTSDGLDLLYVREPGTSITIRQTIAEGNAGNQIKTNGPTLIENSIVAGNCAYFEGQPFTFNVDACRAAGNALSLNLRAGNPVTVTNNTLTSEGDCLVIVVCEGTCDGSESVRMRNNIFQGQTDVFQPWENTCLVYHENFPGDPFDLDYSLIDHVKGDPCPVGANDLCQAPGLVDTSIDAFNAHLLSSSPAIGAARPGDAPADDFDSLPRDLDPDLGAYEWRESSGWIYLPVLRKG